MEKFSTPVVTSKAADDHYNDIKTQYGNVMQGINDQAINVRAYQDKVSMETKEREAQDSMNAKEAMANDMKTKELAIKQAALGL